MTGLQHSKFATYSSALIVIGGYVDIVNIETCGGIFVGGLFPDIDTKESVFGRFSPLPILHKYLSKIKITILGHGKFTHILMINLAIFYLAYYYKSNFLWGMAFGYLTHLYADDITGNQLKYLYFPFKRRKK